MNAMSCFVNATMNVPNFVKTKMNACAFSNENYLHELNAALSFLPYIHLLLQNILDKTHSIEVFKSLCEPKRIKDDFVLLHM